jgi:hypothetical protein
MNIRPYPVLIAILIFGFPHLAGAENYNDSFFLKNVLQKVYPIDSDANAVILYENTVVEIVEGPQAILNVTRTERIIKVLDPEKSDAADIHLYTSNAGGVYGVSEVIATTYNQENGKLEKTELNINDIIRKKESNGNYSASFTLPNVKKGSVVRYSYKTVSDFRNSSLTWHIQQTFPKLLAEFTLQNHYHYEFASIAHVSAQQHEFPTISAAEASMDSFCHIASTLGNENCYIRRNVPGILSEPYVVNRENFIEHIEWDVQGLSASNFAKKHPVYNSWKSLNDRFWLDLRIKAHLSTSVGFLNDIVDSLTRDKASDYEKAQVIYNYVRGQFSVTDNSESLYRIDLHYLNRYKEGNLNEVNLFLVAMLKHAGIEASPIILSTINEVSPNKNFPVLDRMSYLACVATIDSGYVLLDASDKNNSFGLLPEYCYNGYAWILGDEGHMINLSANVIKEKQAVGAKLYDFGDSTAKFDITVKFGMFQSVNFRKKLARDKEQTEKKIKDALTGLPENVEVTDAVIENENKPDENIVVKYSCILSYPKNTNLFYVNSKLLREFDKNPFQNKKRSLPIQYPYKYEYVYNLNVSLPKGIGPDTVSAPMEMDFQNAGMHYKKFTAYFPQMQTFTLSTTFAVNNTSFDKENYIGIKDFYQKVIDDENQVLVFRKSEK